MATLAEHPVVAQASYDQDIDTFLNLDQLSYTPSKPARSKIGLTPQASLPNPDFVPNDARSSSFASSSQSPVTFPAPSHQYDEHKQQTGLPPGALAQAIPFSQVTPIGYGAASPGFAMNGDMFQPQMKRDEVPMDFNSTPAPNLSDMDLEADNNMVAAQGFFYSPNPSKTQYVDPNALGGQEMVPMGQPTQIGRMYPGMHQQAAMAKAAQQQRQHQQLQHQRPVAAPQTQNPHAANPLVEERITLLLQQMKSASGRSSDSSPSPSVTPHLSRSKKDEQDMDEDERLLASEEGKKLSSKERRQLRNKVSARAFRSRRKEYIVQLESEVTQKNNEAQELRLENRALYEENARLTDLARQLLSSPPFAQYLDEMNVSGLPSAQTPMPHQSQQQPQQQPTNIPQGPMQQANLHKEPNPNHTQQEFQMPQTTQMPHASQVGMMMVPSQGIDVSTMNMSNGGWNTGIDMNFGNPSVFAVLEVPEPSVLDIAAISGKSCGFVGSSLNKAFSGIESSPLERLPHFGESGEQVAADAGDANVEIGESDPVLALFADQPKKTTTLEFSGESPFHGAEPYKSSTLELVVEIDSEAAKDRLTHLCQTMEGAFQRYQVLTTPTADTPGTALALHFPDKTYLFGQISEGTQRACTEVGTKLTHVSDIFLTGRMGWDSTGGLLGLILTQADGVSSANASAEENRLRRSLAQSKGSEENASCEKAEEKDVQQQTVTLHGTRNLVHTIATARRFIFRKGLPLFLKEYDVENTSRTLSVEANDPFWVMPISPYSASPRPHSPRKRSLEEFREGARAPTKLGQHDHDQAVRRSVVHSMFNSDWSLDSLIELPLASADPDSPIFVRNPLTKDLESYSGPKPGDSEADPGLKVLVRAPWPGANFENIPLTTHSDETLCYIIKSHDVRGKFNVQKALQHGVQPGKDFGNLANGQSVTSVRGSTVTPDMVLDSARPGKGIAVIDLPTSEYVESLLRRPEWRSSTVLTELKAFVWILGPGVVEHPRLQEFMGATPEWKHFVSSRDSCPNYLTMQSAAGSAIRMAGLRPKNYPIPIHDNALEPRAGSTVPDAANSMLSGGPKPAFEPVEPGLILNMAPEFEISREELVPRLNTALIVKDMPNAPIQMASDITKRLTKPDSQERLRQFLRDLPGANVEIITLGTGSSIPSKYRNVSSTLIHVPDKGYYLLDCGEGTLGQLKRIFNPEQLREVFQNLRLIWVSHLHADHHLGTVSVLKAWYQENYPGGVPPSAEAEWYMHKILQQKRLFVVSAKGMIEWLEEYASVEDFGFARLTPLIAWPGNPKEDTATKFTYRHCCDDGSYPGRLVQGAQPPVTKLSFQPRSGHSNLLRQATGLSDLNVVNVIHCRDAYAVSLSFPDGFKISFSGDCRPSKNFAKIGEDSTVLIHEATFQDDMAGSAKAKRHSTVSEAIGVGRHMRARAILLTHFSQRYQKGATIGQPQKGELVEAEAEDPQDLELTNPNIPMDHDAEDNLASNEEEPAALPSVFEKPLPAVVPIVSAFDYMRVRVRDMFELEAYTPAIHEIYNILEKATADETKKRKALHEAEEIKRKEEKIAKRLAKEQKQAAGAKVAKAKAKARKSAEPRKERPSTTLVAPEGEGESVRLEGVPEQPESENRARTGA
ncbi:hypothetical protein BJX70DRAFT_386225 [Aspergillus crustosus]